MGRILLRSVRRAARVSGSRAARGTGYNEMITIKRTAVIIFMIFFIFISAFDCRYFSYAETSVWQPLNSSSELVEAFQYYCKSRDLTIDGSVANAVTQFTTGAFNSCCNTLGINITQLQAELMVDRSNAPDGVRFLFSASGIDAYNRIFAQFLQDNNLDIGDENVNENVYSGRYFTDDQGNTCFVFVINQSGFGIGSQAAPIEEGTPYIYTLEDFSNLTSAIPTTTYSFCNISYTLTNKYYNTQYTKGVESGVDESAWFGSWLYYPATSKWYKATYCIIFNNYNNSLWVGYHKIVDGNNNVNTVVGRKQLNVTSSDLNQNSPSVNINIVSNQINNNNYEGDTIINNYGVTGDDDQPVNPLPPDNPYDDPDPDSGDPPSDWDIDLPDLDINWILTGKEKKFPWDIPFNLMFALSLLNAEPEAPHLEGTLDFGFTEWDYNLDLSDFDDVAEICRNFEFLAFLIGLMLMTKNLIGGN